MCGQRLCLYQMPVALFLFEKPNQPPACSVLAESERIEVRL